ncbi:MAG TPA: cupin domain-containing protein [Acidimicrobiales bacterium]|nr:cupin domain-containing protein [Acidimicrobiales bacterium]
MATIKFGMADEIPVRRLAEITDGNGDADRWRAQGAAEVSVRHIFGAADELELFEVTREPGAVSAPHAHVEDEIMYILEGSVHFGNREVGVGSAVFVPAWTLYGFRVGDQGVRFLNFRPRSSERKIVFKEEFLAERTQH